jgi:lysophospholipase L1-like esterase
MARILVFGDSITYGAWDLKGGWVQRLREFLDEKNLSDLDNADFSVYNLGISGDTTEDLLERFEFEAEKRMKEDDEMIFIFAIGINDSQFIHSLNSPKISVVKFQDNFQKFINFAQKFSQKIIFVGLTSVDEAKTIPWDIDKSYKNEHIKRYNQIIKQICEENKIHFIKLFDKFSKINYKKLLKDGLHPNSEGHQKIFEIVRDFLEEKKII